MFTWARGRQKEAYPCLVGIWGWGRQKELTAVGRNMASNVGTFANVRFMAFTKQSDNALTMATIVNCRVSYTFETCSALSRQYWMRLWCLRPRSMNNSFHVQRPSTLGPTSSERIDKMLDEKANWQVFTCLITSRSCFALASCSSKLPSTYFPSSECLRSCKSTWYKCKWKPTTDLPLSIWIFLSSLSMMTNVEGRHLSRSHDHVCF